MIIYSDGINEDCYIEEPQSIVDIERIYGLEPHYTKIFEKNENVYMDSYDVDSDEIVIVDDVDDLPPVDIVCVTPESGDSDDEDDVAVAVEKTDTDVRYSIGISGRRRRMRIASRHRRCLRKSCYRCRRPCPKSHAEETLSTECRETLTYMVRGLASMWNICQKYPHFQVPTLNQNLALDCSQE